MSDESLVLRAATGSDRPDLVRIWRRAVEATHGFLTPSDIDEIEGHVGAGVLVSSAVTVARRAEIGIVGWIGVRDTRVEALFVDPAAHRQGVGSALLDAVTAAMPTVTLDVNEHNPSAVAFYRRRGFVQIGRSERDDEGRPFPLLHMRRGWTAEVTGGVSPPPMRPRRRPPRADR